MMKRVLPRLVLALILGAMASACFKAIGEEMFPHVVARPQGQDCLVHTLQFRQASLGGGAWSEPELEGWGASRTCYATGCIYDNSAYTQYTACPAAPKADPQVVKAWVSGGGTPKVYATEPTKTETTQVNGVVMRYTNYYFYYYGCEGWAPGQDTARCAPPAVERPTQ